MEGKLLYTDYDRSVRRLLLLVVCVVVLTAAPCYPSHCVNVL